MLPTKFQFIWESGFRGEEFFFRNQPIKNKNGLWRPCLSTDRNEMSKFYREPSYQVSVHLAKQFQRRRFKKNRPIRNKNCLWWPYLLMDRDEMFDWLISKKKFFSSETAFSNELKFGRKHLWNSSIKIAHFVPIH
jgi:hypothetical protein